MTVIKGLINTFLDKELYSKAIALIEKEVCAVEGVTVTKAEKCVLLEHLSHCYSVDGRAKLMIVSLAIPFFGQNLFVDLITSNFFL